MAKKPSEYEGTGVTKAGVRPTAVDLLTADEKLRLVYRTGQDADPEAEVDPLAFRGGVTGQVEW